MYIVICIYYNLFIIIMQIQLSVPSLLELGPVLNCVKIAGWDRSAAPMDVAMSVRPYRIVL